ncbi:hypothetical protein GCM10011316_26590 [Roseibium aquae]|uniref:Invasion protein IalB n=2 Tax=Roseibium aquae TaxID=1323746 RepID=A0A916TKU8_9HYPH|nr:hypothetical protein GCM10011316_26590 [Roseibium aquae]
MASFPAYGQETSQNDVFWETSCNGAVRETSNLTCQATQRVVTTQGGQLVFKIDVIYPQQGQQPVLAIQAPLGFYLPGKLGLAVDGTRLRDLDVATCDNRGCFLQVAAEDDLISAMKAGGKLQIDFATTAGNRQTLELPLTGFTKAIDSID